MVNRDAAFGHHRFEVAVADWVAAVPSYRPEHDLTLKMPSLEIVHAPTPRIIQREQFTDHPNFATEPWNSAISARVPSTAAAGMVRPRVFPVSLSNQANNQ